MTRLTVFSGHNLLTAGEADAVRDTLLALAPECRFSLLLFDDATGKQVDIDLRGDATPVPPRGRGRPKLGVQAREVTLLPRHWDWLAGQPGGASVALRRLVETASKAAGPRAAKDRAYHFLMAIAGDLPRYEEALRALYAGDRAAFDAALADWPADVRAHGASLAEGAFATAA